MNIERSSILIVDDTVENLRLISRILKEQTYRIRIASNGKRAGFLNAGKHRLC